MNTLFLKKTAMAKTMLQTTKIAMSVLLTGLVMTSVQAAPKKAEPIDLQTIAIQRCISEATALKMTDAKSAQKLCSCKIGVQATNLKLGEFWAMQSMAMNGKDPRSLPSLQRIMPQLEKCEEGLTINKPSTAQQSATPAPAPADEASKP